MSSKCILCPTVEIQITQVWYHNFHRQSCKLTQNFSEGKYWERHPEALHATPRRLEKAMRASSKTKVKVRGS